MPNATSSKLKSGSLILYFTKNKNPGLSNPGLKFTISNWLLLENNLILSPAPLTLNLSILYF